MIKSILKNIEQCDDFHNRCDYLLEHDESTHLIEYITELEKENKELHNKIDESIDSINKILNLDYDKFCNYNTYKNSLKEIRLILKDSDVNENN